MLLQTVCSKGPFGEFLALLARYRITAMGCPEITGDQLISHQIKAKISSGKCSAGFQSPLTGSRKPCEEMCLTQNSTL